MIQVNLIGSLVFEDGKDAVDDFVLHGIEHTHFVFALLYFSLVIVSEFPFEPDGTHGGQVQEGF